MPKNVIYTLRNLFLPTLCKQPYNLQVGKDIQIQMHGTIKIMNNFTG